MPDEWYRVTIQAILLSDKSSMLWITNDCNYTYTNDYDAKDECIGTKCGNISVLQRIDHVLFKYNEFEIFKCSLNGASVLMDSMAFPVTMERYNMVLLAKRIIGTTLITGGATHLLSRFGDILTSFFEK